MGKTEKEFQEELNEMYPPYEIGYLTFYAGDIMREMDPTAFDCAYAESGCADDDEEEEVEEEEE